MIMVEEEIEEASRLMREIGFTSKVFTPRSIVGQQLSTKAARTIYGRLADLYEGKAPTPEQLLATGLWDG